MSVEINLVTETMFLKPKFKGNDTSILLLEVAIPYCSQNDLYKLFKSFLHHTKIFLLHLYLAGFLMNQLLILQVPLPGRLPLEGLQILLSSLLPNIIRFLRG